MAPEARLDLPALEAFTGRGVRVLVVDSGVSDHPCFGGRPPASLGLEAQAEGWAILPEPPKDMYGHGTAVCGVLRAVAPEAELTSLRVLGTDLRAHSARVIHALEWALDQGFHLVNCSFGSPSLQHLPEYKRVVDAAHVRNVWLVAAANAAGTHPEYPAAFPSVFSTRAAELADPLALRRVAGDLIEFEARGLDVEVPWKGGGTRTVSGSSLAAPHLCGLLARLRQARPELATCEARALAYGWAATSGS